MIARVRGDRTGAVGAGNQVHLSAPARLDAHLCDGLLQQEAYGGGARVVQEAVARPGRGFPLRVRTPPSGARAAKLT
ncbi:hypothetical protein [Streptomyces sp. NBC_01538]|uniref:hypothetical protein n=1 Tax=Streptomyces sp. NBC_01538 TaxID=2903897 RepID=UPI0038676A3A